MIENGTAVSGSGNAFLPTTFLKLAGIEQLPLVSDPATGFPKATITGGGGSNLEVSVMLYTTGSMCDDAQGPCWSSVKLNALKDAAYDLVNIVVLDDQSTYTSRVALIPFAQHMRVEPNGAGGPIMKVLTSLDPNWTARFTRCDTRSLTGNAGETQLWQCTNDVTAYGTYKVRPCLSDRFFNASNSVDYTDAPPGPNAWLTANDGTRHPQSTESANTPFTTQTGTTQAVAAYHDDNYNDDLYGACIVPDGNIMQPLTSNKSVLLDRISSLQAERATAGALGTAFSWYALAPKWSSIWPSASQPAPYSQLTAIQPNGNPKLRKFAILMSDGVYNSMRNWSGPDQQMVSDHAKKLCSGMKAAGFEIYTVAFDLDSLPSTERAIAEDTLKSCGSSIEAFYNMLEPKELEVAFRDIAVQLSMISLSR